MLKNRNSNIDLSEFNDLDSKRRDLIAEVEGLREREIMLVLK